MIGAYDFQYVCKPNGGILITKYVTVTIGNISTF